MAAAYALPPDTTKSKKVVGILSGSMQTKLSPRFRLALHSRALTNTPLYIWWAENRRLQFPTLAVGRVDELVGFVTVGEAHFPGIPFQLGARHLDGNDTQHGDLG